MQHLGAVLPYHRMNRLIGILCVTIPTLLQQGSCPKALVYGTQYLDDSIRDAVLVVELLVQFPCLQILTPARITDVVTWISISESSCREEWPGQLSSSW